MKKIIFNNFQIKLVALLLGYSFWYIFSQSHTIRIRVNVPVCFYNIPNALDIQCKDTVKVELFAKRADLYTIDRDTLAFHIDAHNCHRGDMVIKLTQEQLLLPETIRMARCYPSNIAACITEKR